MDLNQFKDYLRQRENPIIFDKKGKFIYFPTNKVMQTTLARRILKKRCIVKKDNKQLWNHYFDKIDFNKVYKFGITRHPVSKFESAFNYLKKLDKWAKILKIKEVNINDFIKTRFRDCSNPFLINNHFERQYESFFFQEHSLVDDLFQIENKKDLTKLYDKLKIGPKLRKTHRNKTVHKETLDNESIQILESIYQNDIEPLNYSSKIKSKRV